MTPRPKPDAADRTIVKIGLAQIPTGVAEDEMRRCDGKIADLRLGLACVQEDAARVERERDEARRSKDGAYSERDKVVAAFAAMASALGWPVYLGVHEGAWDNDWRGIVFIDTPEGQVSWHYHDSERAFFWMHSGAGKPWDGHSTSQKYERLWALTHDGVANDRAETAEAALSREREKSGRLAEGLRLLESWGRNFYAMVAGECPSLLEDDHNAFEFAEALAAAAALVEPAPAAKPTLAELQALLGERCCASSHEPPDTACQSFKAGANGRCVWDDHEEKCHPGPGATCEIGRDVPAPAPETGGPGKCGTNPTSRSC